MPDTLLPGLENLPETQGNSNEFLYPTPSLPGIRPDETPEAEEINRGMTRARERIGNADETPFEFMVRRAIPLVSAIPQYMEGALETDARLRARSGGATALDFEDIARAERYRNLDRQRSVGESVVSGLAYGAGIAGEMALTGGALRAAGAIPTGASAFSRAGLTGIALATAASPASVAPRWVQNNMDAGRSANDFRGLPGAFALGFAQNAIVGSLGHVAGGIGGEGIGGTAARVFARTAIGMAEQQGFDIAASAIDDVGQNVFGASLGMNTNYGLVGNILRGDSNTALRDGVTQALTFALFAGLHEAQNRPAPRPVPGQAMTAPRPGVPPESPIARQPFRVDIRGFTPNPEVRTSDAIMGETRRYLDHMGRQGLSPEAAGTNLRMITQAIGSTMTQEGVTRESARQALIDQIPEGPARDYAFGLVDRLSRYIESPRLADQSPRTEAPGATRAAQKVASGQEVALRPPEALAGPKMGVPEPSSIAQRMAARGRQAAAVIGPNEGVPKPAPFPADLAAQEAVSGAVERLGNVKSLEEVMADKKLSPLQKEAVAKRIRLGMTQEEIGAERGVTREAARQIEKKALAKLGITGQSADAFLGEKGSRVYTPALEGAAYSPKELRENPAVKAMVDRANSPLTSTEARANIIEKISGLILKGKIDAANKQLRKTGEVALTPEDYRAISELSGGRVDRAGAETAETSQVGQPAKSSKAVSAKPKDRSNIVRRTVSAQELIPTELQATEESLAKARERIGDTYKPVVAIEMPDGELHILDGHHTATIAAERGADVPVLSITQERYRELKRRGNSDPAIAQGLLRTAGEKKVADTLAARFGKQERLNVTRGDSASSEFRPVTADEIASVKGLSVHHSAVLTKAQATIMQSNLPIAKKVEYLRNQLTILSNMPETAAALQAASLRKTTFYGSVLELNSELAKSSPAVRAALEAGDLAGGLYKRGTGELFVDGGTRDASGAHITGHEMAHAIDGPKEAVSNSPEIRDAYLKEGLKGTLGDYARTDPHEFFAEALGAVYSGELTPADLKAKMPLTYEALFGRGLIKEAEGKGEFVKPKGVFDYPINEGDTHVDMLLQERLQRSPAQAVKKFLQEESGHLDMQVLREVTEQYGGKARDALQHIRDSYAELAGEMGPRTTRLNREVGEALARFNVADTYARFAAPTLTAKVLGNNTSVEFRQKLGAVLTERRLRYMRSVYTNTDADAASRVTSIIGAEGSPFKTLDDYRTAWQDPEVSEAVKRYEQIVVPAMDEAFRRSQGMEPDDPINSTTQIPGSPINLKANRAGEQSPSIVRTKSGNLRNEKLKQNKFARQAYGDADGYDVDIGNIIEHSLSHQYQNAAKAELVRKMVSNDLAVWAKPGEQVKFQTRSGPQHGAHFDMQPPAGTQDSLAGRGTLYVHPEMRDEFRKALRVDDPMKFKTLEAGMRMLTTATLVSTAEITYHTKNQLSFLMKPGVRPWELFRYYRDVVKHKPEIMDRLVELARIGTMKEHGLEGGTGGGFDVLKYGGKFLDTTRKALALMGDDAYTRLVKAGLAENTETGRRNFINQLGQYNKFAGHKFLKFLRETQIGPFSVAGTNYAVQGVRSVTMGHGAQATSVKADLQMRAGMLAKTVGALALAAIINNAIWKRLDGSDDTPLGAIRVGTTPDGRARYYDLMDLIGLKRGLRIMGLLSLIQGRRSGMPTEKVIDKSVKDAVTALVHPMAGPGAQFGLTAAYGIDARGFKTVERAQPGQSQAALNIREAFLHANPVIGTFAGHGQAEKPLSERVMELAGPFGIRTAPPRR